MQPRLSQHPDKIKILKLIEEIYLSLKKINQNAVFNWPSEKAETLFGDCHFVIVDGDNGDLKAFICYQEINGDFEIIALGVSPLSQRCGSMRKLFGFFVEKICRNESKIYLEVHERNVGALSLYKNLGFRIDGIRKNYYSDGSAAINMSIG